MANKEGKKFEYLAWLLKSFKWTGVFLFLYAVFDAFSSDLLRAAIEFFIALILYFGLPYLLVNIFFKSILKKDKSDSTV